MSDKALARVGQIASTYHSESLAGANEQFHIQLRDNVIPAGGGESALELGCGRGLWTQVLCDRYERLDVVDGSAELLAARDAPTWPLIPPWRKSFSSAPQRPGSNLYDVPPRACGRARRAPETGAIVPG